MAPSPPDPDRFFLATAFPGDDARFRAPARGGVKVTPLVDATKAYAAMERAILAARDTVHLCWWEFNPDTRIVDSTVRRAVGGGTWMDLLEAKALGRAGRVATAHVRMIIADLDPIFFKTMHEKTWSAINTVMARRLGLDAAAQARLEVIAGIHPAIVPRFAELDLFVRMLLNTQATILLERWRDELNQVVADAGTADAEDKFRNLPGLWPNVVFDPAASSFALAAPLTLSLRPASHHQKLCITDGETAFCGGLDIAPERIDDHRHTAPAPWHDIQCQVEGAPVFDMERNFFSRWNTELARFDAFVAEANGVQPRFQLDAPRFAAMAAQAGTPSFKRRPGRSRVQVIRTLSGEVPAASLLPALIRSDIEACYLKAVSQAEQFIYLENQYVRWLPLADAIVARHAQRPIKVIFVVPTLPEEIRAAEPDALTLHGVFLQNRVLDQLAAALGADFGLFSLVQRRVAPPPTPPATADPLNLFGSAQVYVHSKIMIVDDVFATIGSANTNGRGFFVDGELNVAWADPSAVRGFRLKSWSHLLGSPRDLGAWKPVQFVDKWQSIATFNVAAPAETRRGFVVPFDRAHAIQGREIPAPDADKLAVLGEGAPSDATHLA